MTRTHISVLALSFAALVAGQAVAATDAPITREQVRAELAEAKRDGLLDVHIEV